MAEAPPHDAELTSASEEESRAERLRGRFQAVLRPAEETVPDSSPGLIREVKGGAIHVPGTVDPPGLRGRSATGESALLHQGPGHGRRREQTLFTWILVGAALLLAWVTVAVVIGSAST